MEITAQPTGSVSHTFINRLILFYSPRRFNAESSAFDMGYEQCKRDLRELVVALIPQALEYDRDPTPAVEPAPVKTWLFGKR